MNLSLPEFQATVVRVTQTNETVVICQTATKEGLLSPPKSIATVMSCPRPSSKAEGLVPAMSILREYPCASITHSKICPRIIPVQLRSGCESLCSQKPINTQVPVTSDREGGWPAEKELDSLLKVFVWLGQGRYCGPNAWVLLCCSVQNLDYLSKHSRLRLDPAARLGLRE